MEHPTGKFSSAVDAMEDAVRRLRKLPKWERWISFNAQGEGSEPESCQFAEIRMLREKMVVGDKPLDLAQITQSARVGSTALMCEGNLYSVGCASPRETAQILDAIFRNHFCIRPFADEGDDYSVGAEWGQ